MMTKSPSKRRAISSTSINSLPFSQVVRGSNTPALGVSTLTVSYSTLFSDLSATRQILPQMYTVRFAPLGTLSTNVLYAQILITDPTTASPVPVSPIKLLSLTNETIFNVSLPRSIGWIDAGNVAVSLSIVFNNASGTPVANYEITSHCRVARDILA